jgi:hypothetical protein
MAKPTKKSIREDLAKWEALAIQVREIETQRDGVLKPFQNDYANKTATIVRVADELTAPLKVEMAVLDKSIKASMTAGINDAGAIAIQSVNTDGAIVEVVATLGPRVIIARDFFNVVSDEKRNDSFWDCISVGVEKAVKLIGSAVDVISTKKRTLKVVLKLIEAG